MSPIFHPDEVSGMLLWCLNSGQWISKDAALIWLQQKIRRHALRIQGCKRTIEFVMASKKTFGVNNPPQTCLILGLDNKHDRADILVERKIVSFTSLPEL